MTNDEKMKKLKDNRIEEMKEQTSEEEAKKAKKEKQHHITLGTKRNINANALHYKL